MTTEVRSADKFAFIGPASVGKTTMTSIWMDRFSGDYRVNVLEEGAQLFFQNHPDITSDRSVDLQEKIQDFVLKREQAAYQPETRLIIADRSVIDPIVYTQLFDSAVNANRLLERVIEWLPTYTSFILLDPSGVPDDSRPNRMETPGERLAIYDAFGEFCVDNNLPNVEVSGPLNERAHRVHEVIYERTRLKALFNSSTHAPSEGLA